MGKNLTSILGTSGPSHPLQSTIQPILGVLEQFWPKTLLSRRIPQLAVLAHVLQSHEVGGGKPFGSDGLRVQEEPDLREHSRFSSVVSGVEGGKPPLPD